MSGSEVTGLKWFGKCTDELDEAMKLFQWLSAAAIVLLTLPGVPMQARQNARVFNVKNYGTKADGRYVDDGTIQAGSRLLTSAAGIFTPGDVGKPIHILRAGPSANGRVDPLRTTIVAVRNATSVELAAPAQTSASNVRVSWGTGNHDFIQNAINAAAAGGGTVYIPAGTYRISRVLTITSSNIRLTGDGDASIIYMSDVYDLRDGGPRNQGDGKPNLFVGVKGTPISNIEVDHLKFVNSGREINNPINGDGLLRTGDGVVNNFKFHDLAVETTSRCGITQAAMTDGFEIYNNRITGGLHGFYITGQASNGYVHDNRLTDSRPPNRIRHYDSVGIVVKNQKNTRVTGNTVDGYQYGILIAELPELHVTIEHNTILHSQLGISTNMGTDMVFANNTIDTAGTGIWIRATAPIDHLKILNNTIRNVPTSWGIYVQKYLKGTIANVDIQGNKLEDCYNGLQFIGVDGSNVISDNTMIASHIKGGAPFSIGNLSGTTKLTNNTATGYQKSAIAANVVQSRNQIPQ